MLGFGIRLIGREKTDLDYERLRLAALVLGNLKLTVTAGDSSVGRTNRYARGIETGFHRSGATARKAGGAFYMRGAWAAVRPSVGHRLASRLSEGPNAVEAEAAKIGQDVVEIARGLVPRVSGDLESSIKALLQRGGRRL